MLRIGLDLPEAEFQRLNTLYPANRKSSTLGARAIELVKFHFRGLDPQCRFRVPDDGTDLEIIQGGSSQRIEVKGTADSDIAWMNARYLVGLRTRASWKMSRSTDLWWYVTANPGSTFRSIRKTSKWSPKIAGPSDQDVDAWSGGVSEPLECPVTRIKGFARVEPCQSAFLPGSALRHASSGPTIEGEDQSA